MNPKMTPLYNSIMNLSERDKNTIWHPFTQHQTASEAIPIVKGNGAILYDDNGKEYIDAVSSWWTNLYGHANPHIGERIKQQLDELEHVIFAGFTHPQAIQLAENLLQLLPANQSKVFFSDNGSTSVEVALKMAVQYWSNSGKKKNRIIAFHNSYHGDTFGAMSIGARGVFNQPFEPMMFDVEFIDTPNPDNYNEVISRFQDIIAHQDVAAFIFEPLIQGSGGMLMYEAQYLEALIKLAQANDVINIADEVMTGFGRTGRKFASNYLHHQPDIMCLSKGITGGFMPLGITTCTQPIYDAFLSDDKLKTFFHGHSYTGNPLACAAANAACELLEQYQPVINELTQMQEFFKNQLKTVESIENLRQLGTIVAFDVKTSAQSGYFNNLRDFLYEQFIQRGLLLRPLGNTIYIMPPYCITREQLENVYEGIHEVLGLLNNQ